MVALFVALGGVAYAGSKIGTSEIKNGAVTSRKLANEAVTARNVDKAKLGSVPKARTVGGLRVQKFPAKPPPGTGLTPLKTVGTLKLEVGCTGGGGIGHPLFTVVPAKGASPQGTRVSVTLDGNAGQTANNTVGKGQGALSRRTSARRCSSSMDASRRPTHPRIAAGSRRAAALDTPRSVG